MTTPPSLATLAGWVEHLGHEITEEAGGSFVIASKGPLAGLPRFVVQCSDNWVLLSILPMLAPGQWRREELGRMLLEETRTMRVAKFALDSQGAVVLCAELPTESLDESEFADAVERMARYGLAFLATRTVTPLR